MNMKNRHKNIGALVAATSLLASPVSHTLANEQPPTYDTVEETVTPQMPLNIQLRAAYDTTGELTTRGLFNYTPDGVVITGLVERLDDATLNFGLDFRSDRMRANVSGSSEGDFGLLGALYGVDSFAGAGFNRKDNQNQVAAFGGHDFGKFAVQGTVADDGAYRAVGFVPTNEGVFGVGGGQNGDGKYEVNMSYSDPNMWAAVRFGDRNTDARLVLGDVNPEFTKLYLSTTGHGINDLVDAYGFAPQEFKFGIGTLVDMEHGLAGGMYDFLDTDSGSKAVQVRWRENNDIRLTGAYRVGDVGPFKGVAVVGGPTYDLQQDAVGANVGLNTQVGNLELRLVVDHNKDDTRAGIMVGFNF